MLTSELKSSEELSSLGVYTGGGGKSEILSNSVKYPKILHWFSSVTVSPLVIGSGLFVSVGVVTSGVAIC